MGQRQLNRLLKLWVVEAGLDPSDYSIESLRRTKALQRHTAASCQELTHAAQQKACSFDPASTETSNLGRYCLKVGFGTDW